MMSASHRSQVLLEKMNRTKPEARAASAKQIHQPT